jgi:hypothetical protein
VTGFDQLATECQHRRGGWTLVVLRNFHMCKHKPRGDKHVCQRLAVAMFSLDHIAAQPHQWKIWP